VGKYLHYGLVDSCKWVNLSSVIHRFIQDCAIPRQRGGIFFTTSTGQKYSVLNDFTDYSFQQDVLISCCLLSEINIGCLLCYPFVIPLLFHCFRLLIGYFRSQILRCYSVVIPMLFRCFDKIKCYAFREV